MKFLQTTPFVFIFLFLNIDCHLIAQVGINTSKPKGLLHVSGQANEGNDIVFTDEGNLGIGTDNPKAKLDVEGTMQISGSTSAVKIRNHILTSDAKGIASWTNNNVTLQNKVSSYNVELSTSSLFDKEQRFTITSINCNELNLISNNSFFALNPVPRGYYVIIFNFELENANSIATIFFSKLSFTLPNNQVETSINITGKKVSNSIFVNMNMAPEYNYIYIGLYPRSRYMFSWSTKKVTYWNTPWGLPNNENFVITGTIDIIKLG